jgi:hypothetical protein
MGAGGRSGSCAEPKQVGGQSVGTSSWTVVSGFYLCGGMMTAMCTC